ncbi:MAG: tRNA (adenosine(37)-N6)-threonylcarbamoyltransferase complex dimerization subunit type 1 TsaB [Cyanothece sp. SIO2G6]|nr:tRNA (adenosine(37)-N6)-threonylcarbamoyltransferase complex dimerization subunit type 1 TsaB [Cyanothece sp. SIO2G6]
MTQPIPAALALHTTTSQLGLCLAHPHQGISTNTWNLGRELSSQLHHILLTFTQPHGLTQLEFLAVATGPGGFTSTRIGVVTARTLAQQLDIPLFGVSSLAALAWHWAIASASTLVPQGKDVPAIAIQMPARRGQIFAAIYSLEPCPNNRPNNPDLGDDSIPVRERNLSGQRQIRPQAQQQAGTCAIACQPFCLCPYQPEQVLSQDVWQQHLAQLPRTVKVIAVEGDLGHTVIDILDLAWQEYRAKIRPHWSVVHPFYGQSPV